MTDTMMHGVTFAVCAVDYDVLPCIYFFTIWVVLDVDCGWVCIASWSTGPLVGRSPCSLIGNMSRNCNWCLVRDHLQMLALLLQVVDMSSTILSRRTCIFRSHLCSENWRMRVCFIWCCPSVIGTKLRHRNRMYTNTDYKTQVHFIEELEIE